MSLCAPVHCNHYTASPMSLCTAITAERSAVTHLPFTATTHCTRQCNTGCTARLVTLSLLIAPIIHVTSAHYMPPDTAPGSLKRRPCPLLKTVYCNGSLWVLYTAPSPAMHVTLSLQTAPSHCILASSGHCLYPLHYQVTLPPPPSVHCTQTLSSCLHQLCIHRLLHPVTAFPPMSPYTAYPIQCICM